MSLQDEVIDLEQRRCSAIAACDFDALERVPESGYLHVFGTGETLGRAGYIEAVRKEPRVPTRTNLVVRIFGDVAVVTGDLLNLISRDGETVTVQATATQVAVKAADGWQFVSCQLTPKREPRYTRG